MQKCHSNTRTSATDGMSECDGSAVDVKFVRIKVEITVASDDLGCERLVQFDEIEVFQGKVVLLLELPDRGYWSNPHDSRIDARRSGSEYASHRFEVVVSHKLTACDDNRGCPISNTGR